MNIRELYRRSEVNGTDIVHYFKSPFHVWCDYHAPEEEQDEESDYMKLIAERGNKHEKAFIQQKHPGMVPLKLETTEEILDEIKKGTPAFDNLPIFDPDTMFSGKPDLLEINYDAPSKFGKFHYIVKEIKSVKEPRTKKYYIMQGAFYNYVLGLLQEYTPKVFYIVNKGGEEIPFNFSDYETDLKIAIKEIQEIKKGKDISPTLDLSYPWHDFSEKKAFETRDITLINGISNVAKPKLNQIGINTVEDLNKVPISKLITLKGIGELKATQFKRSAQALTENKPVIFGKPNLPNRKVEIFFDLEATTPDEELNMLSQVNYLFGMIIRKSGEEKFIPLVANNLNEEEKIFREFIDLVLKEEDFVIYYYSIFEKTNLNRMFEQYGTNEETKRKIMENAIDLQKEIKNSITFPTTKNGLKEIAQYLGFQWRHKDVNAQESMAWYFEFMEKGDKEKLQKIIDYNEDDCRATLIIKDWLVKKFRD